MPALNHSPADILSRLLIARNLGTDPILASSAWPVYVASEPAPAPGSVPDEIITVTDSTGTNDGRINPTGERAEHYGVQVKVRARRHDTGWERADRIHTAMNEGIRHAPVIVGAHAYEVGNLAGVRRVRELRKDAKSELLYFVINALMVVRKTSA